MRPTLRLWRHHACVSHAPLQLPDLYNAVAHSLTFPRSRGRVGEQALSGYLHQARRILVARPDDVEDGPTGLPATFETLRWFHLPPACLNHTAAVCS